MRIDGATPSTLDKQPLYIKKKAATATAPGGGGSAGGDYGGVDFARFAATGQLYGGECLAGTTRTRIRDVATRTWVAKDGARDGLVVGVRSATPIYRPKNSPSRFVFLPTASVCFAPLLHVEPMRPWLRPPASR